MTEKNDGGPAYPVLLRAQDELNGGTEIVCSEGLSVRDWFAGMALQGMLAHSRGDPPHGYRPRKEHQHWHQAIAEEAYEIADMMLEARDK